jgi:hypothetical protein
MPKTTSNAHVLGSGTADALSIPAVTVVSRE